MFSPLFTVFCKKQMLSFSSTFCFQWDKIHGGVSENSNSMRMRNVFFLFWHHRGSTSRKARLSTNTITILQGLPSRQEKCDLLYCWANTRQPQSLLELEPTLVLVGFFLCCSGCFGRQQFCCANESASWMKSSVSRWGSAGVAFFPGDKCCDVSVISLSWI